MAKLIYIKKVIVNQSLFYFLNLFLIKYTITDIMYITKFTTTIDAAEENSEKKKKAVVNAIHATTTEEITTLLKFVNNLFELRAGKIIKLEINKVPITLIPMTTTIAVPSAKIMLYSLVFIPVALANDSSNVTAKIRLYINIYITIIQIVIGKI